MVINAINGTSSTFNSKISIKITFLPVLLSIWYVQYIKGSNWISDLNVRKDEHTYGNNLGRYTFDFTQTGNEFATTRQESAFSRIWLDLLSTSVTQRFLTP